MKKIATIGFDDGTWTDIRFAKSLREMKIPATFYLPSEYLDMFHYQMRPSEIRKVYAGFEVGSHSRWHSHPDDFRKTLEVASKDGEWDIRYAREYLQEFFGREVRCHSYPFGVVRWRPNFPSLAEAVETQGFDFARMMMRSRQEVERPIDRYRMKITAELPVDFDDIGEHEAVHLVGHSFRLVKQNEEASVFELIKDMKRNGFEFMTNHDFFTETWANHE